MIRLGVYSRSDPFHHAVSSATGEGVVVQLRLRSPRQLVDLQGIDVLVVDEDDPDIVEAAIDAGGALPVVLAGAGTHSASRRDRWRERCDGFAELDGVDPESVVAAARAVALGLRVTDPRLREGAGPTTAASSTADDALTPREREVLLLLARGKSNSEIALELDVSQNTVKYHLSSLFAKLDAGNRSEATWQAIQRGYLSL